MHGLIWADYVILGILGISSLISLLRGFIREALSLVGWIAAFWLALGFSGDLSARLENEITVPWIRQAVAFVAIFVGALIVTAVILYVVGLLVEKSGLSGTDRMLGIVFGLGRGILIVALLVLVAGLTPLPQDRWWRESMLLPYFQRLAAEVASLLPPDIAGHFNYEGADPSDQEL